MASTIYDITIVGGGPIGLFAAGMAAEMGAMCYLIESRFQYGGTLMTSYPDKTVYNFPGIQAIKGKDLIDMLAKKARSFGVVARFGEYVNDIIEGSRKTVILKSGRREYLSSTAILTTGLKAYCSPLGDRFELGDWDGDGIYEHWPHAGILRNKSVAVVNGLSGDIRVPAAIRKAVRNMTLILDGSFAVEQKLESRLSERSTIEFVQSPWEISKIAGGKRQKTVVLQNRETREARRISVEAVVALYDGQARQALYSNFGIEMMGQQVRVDQKMQTSLARVFAAGDIAWYPGKIKHLEAGIYEAGIAVKNALKLV